MEEVIRYADMPKTGISFRCSVELKDQLNREAKALGIKRSELCEQRISISYSQDSVLKDYKNENCQLRKRVDQITQELKNTPEVKFIIETPHFIKLFDTVKGTSDTITIEGQAQTITYNTPYDLLKALIYSFKLKL